MTLWVNRRGSVALMTGLMAPVMVMAVAMGIEVTSWSVTKVDLQRIADAAAWAGARQYIVSQTAKTATQTAADATQTAADLGEINGVSGTSTRTWNPTSLTTSDNMITAQVVAGVRSVTDNALKVTVSQSIAKTLTRIFPSAQSSVTISATAIAEIVSSSSGGGPQPCLVALLTNAGGVTNDINLSGSPNVTANNCSVRSNSGISLTGTSSLNVAGTYAAGAITFPDWNKLNAITGGTYANQGTITDPYASVSVVQNALSALAAGTTPGPVNEDPNTSWKTQTITPGTYTSLTLGGSSVITMSPGTYYVKGNVTFNGAVKINGSNVTIISTGTLTDTASASVSLTAPTSVSGVGIPGMLFASKATGQSQFSGNVAFPLSGVIYYPNGNMTFSGSVDVSNNASACGEVIAGTVTITGSSILSSTGCGAYGTANFGSLAPAPSIALVQ